MKEIYKDYFATESGEIYSVKTKKYIKKRISSRGYYLVNLSIENKCVTKSLHRLICRAFHDNVDNKKCVNHIDGNKLNNNSSNLEWCSYKENSCHAISHGLINTAIGKRCKNGRFEIDQIQYIRSSKLSSREIAKKLGVSHGSIIQIRNHKTYKWV